jgi:hypothetical protein
LSVISFDQSILFILSDDHSTLAVYNSNENTIKYLPIQIDKNIKIKKIYSVSKALIFHDNNNQVYLQYILNDNNNSIISLEHADILTTKNNCIALLDHSVKQLIIYDIEKFSYGIIRLKTLCDTLCFSEDEKYLFGISSKESFLCMYQIDNGKCLEKLFIENISLFIQTITNRIILNCNNQLVFILINKETTRMLDKKCLLFENPEWICCHEDEDWILASPDHLNNI